MTFYNYGGSARDYISEYLDPDRTLWKSPTTEEEARALWQQMESVFASDGGTGIEEEDFVGAVAEIQEEYFNGTSKRGEQ